MDPSAHYSDPLGEGLSHSSQRAAQLISLVVAGAQVWARRKALSQARRAARDEQADRKLQDEERTLFARARAGWAPIHDPRWIAHADLLQTAHAWGAAAAYADTDPVAASAMRKSEERLRTLHPYAMARFDRLRAEGAGSLDAMREAAPLFAREPHARPGQSGTQRQLGAAPAEPEASPAAGVADGSDGLPAPHRDPGREAERRGQEIASRLQDRARAERGSELDPAELATALEATTSLPAELIARLTGTRGKEQVAAGAAHAHVADLDRTADATADHPAREPAEGLGAARHQNRIADTAGAHPSAGRSTAQLAAESFPYTAADGIRAAANGGLQQPGRPPVPAAAAQNARGHGLPA
jgi:hypothetical protein